MRPKRYAPAPAKRQNLAVGLQYGIEACPKSFDFGVGLVVFAIVAPLREAQSLGSCRVARMKQHMPSDGIRLPIGVPAVRAIRLGAIHHNQRTPSPFISLNIRSQYLFENAGPEHWYCELWHIPVGINEFSWQPGTMLTARASFASGFSRRIPPEPPTWRWYAPS